ncbi:hypothetical protein Egran_02917 [Elaphomyces granulatus]|uniref:Uncharacterized protein n=1 Tax=Elaphomyces granulatus TaxID=519963 RepID=A0A232LZR7_9EURO|nr:hypothetical protein Egran_02917 [Elaphomyces granulatus]
MPPRYDDRILWLFLGVSLFFAARGIAAQLRQIRELTLIKHKENKEKIISQGTEDALKLETLQKLSESSSDLRAAALRIVSERSTKDVTRKLLLEDLASKDRGRRNKALTAMYFLVSNRSLSRTSVSGQLKDLRTYAALIDCLCNFLDEHTEETSTTVSPILPKTRPVCEKKALSTLNFILGENISAALEAGIVSRWLLKYPFPCAVGPEPRRHDVVQLMETMWSDDPVMSSIIRTLSGHRDGKRQLRKYGLMVMEENENDSSDGDSDVWV